MYMCIKLLTVLHFHRIFLLTTTDSDHVRYKGVYVVSLSKLKETIHNFLFILTLCSLCLTYQVLSYYFLLNFHHRLLK